MNTAEEDKDKEKQSCNELKTIKYKSMLINGSNWTEPKSACDLTSLDKFLENEKNSNSNEPWSKLDKTAKTRKLIAFAEKYRGEHSLLDAEYSKLIAFFKECLDKKKLQRVKDVVYDKETGEVKEVPALHFLRNSDAESNQITDGISLETDLKKCNKSIHFTLKNIDKRISTTRSLAPKKKGTIKNVTTNDDSDSD
jgi:hypothetical protein